MATPVHVLSRFRPSLAAALLGVLLAALWLAGGTSRADVLGQAIVRLVAFSALAFALLRGPRPDFVAVRPVAWLLVAMIALAGLQLLPLPPSAWSALPARDLLAQANFGHEPDLWRPWAIVPSAARNAAASLVVPACILVLVTALTEGERALLPAVVLGVIVAGALFAVLQFSGIALNNPFIDGGAPAITGNFANRNHFALFIASGCLVATVWLLGKGRVKVDRLAGGFGLVLLFVLLILAGGSRAGLAMALIALPISLFLIWKNRGRLGRKLPRWAGPAGIGVSISFVVLLVVISVGTGRAVAIDRLFAEDPGQDLRSRALPTVIDAIGAYFPFGSGLGGFDPIFRIHETPALLDRVYFNHAHNDYLEIALDTGLPGILLLVAAIGWWAFASFKVWRAKSETEVTHGQLGSAILLLVFVASAFDYPARTPMMMALITIAAIWLGRGAYAVRRGALPGRDQSL